mgnify:CR=1 FL=1
MGMFRILVLRYQTKIMEMVNSDALLPLNDTVENIGEDKFNKTALDEAKVDGNFYSVPLYSHAQVMWVRLIC